ncbi:phosphatidylinositol 3-kinase regulatory subunit beta-like [Rhinatrema bivittatum]|uniref:phosphatidylinositol 3-kinase regulatory subunit beta-like n=1 Tax=Rhinatrema bivittatum TaxID=194408 RepID=UPI00112653D6|nr:phosphatidylinositol 3-kinase regulatory subunit beta-like [Rhinatrema bivittatum]
MCSDSLHYRAIYEYKREREEDISLLPGDILTVSKMHLLTLDYKEGNERIPKGWLNGVNERTKERGEFPGTYVEYVGPVKMVQLAAKPKCRPIPPAPTAAAVLCGHQWCHRLLLLTPGD